ncbi:MAG: bifunctional 4-hydroxy-2-oxoglutarate aldolase/2-dehydro-3-deoxy-phosphogluconate aldolase [Chitinophagaceae bacterium]|nr:bifunctional 4-hydroxy-2-oxoglutarate aldolase/2-dehydro-3-deoxy-phosphogluconate aldolase [Chitinophagaceae bacterium]
MLSYSALIQSLSKQVILPLYYHDDVTICLNRLRSLYKGGIRVIEFTNRGERALSNFREMKKIQEQECPDLIFGVGTIYTASEAEQFAKAGADFLISPIFSKEVSDYCFKNQLPYVPGCMTPTEIYTATEAGCKLVKLFPGHVLGSSFIKSIQELFPGIAFMPTGGMKLDKNSLQDWLSSGAIAVGIGGPLFSSISAESDLTSLVSEIILMKS